MCDGLAWPGSGVCVYAEYLECNAVNRGSLLHLHLFSILISIGSIDRSFYGLCIDCNELQRDLLQQIILQIAHAALPSQIDNS